MPQYLRALRPSEPAPARHLTGRKRPLSIARHAAATQASSEIILALSAVPAASATPPSPLPCSAVAGGSAAVSPLLLRAGQRWRSCRGWRARACSRARSGTPGLAARAMGPRLAYRLGRAGTRRRTQGPRHAAPAARAAAPVLGLVEAIDLAARLEAPAGALIGAASGTSAAKLAADALVSGLVLAAAAGAAAARAGRRPPLPPRHPIGRRRSCGLRPRRSLQRRAAGVADASARSRRRSRRPSSLASTRSSPRSSLRQRFAC